MAHHAASFCSTPHAPLSMPHGVHIGLGSNLGDRPKMLFQALDLIDLLLGVHIVSVSSAYETQPMYHTEQPAFLNACAELSTSLSPVELLDELATIEQALGRTRRLDKGPRTLDLDLLFYDDITLDTPRLTLPHPGLHERAFVLAPLAEIAPLATHPLSSRTVQEMLNALDTKERAGVTLHEEGTAVLHAHAAPWLL